MKTEPALVLFAHGARDALWAQPLERLRDALLRARPRSRIAIAFLELQEPRLPTVLAQLADAGATHIDVAPIFWSTGGHVARDLPALIAQFRAQAPQVSVRLLPVLADLPGMDDFVAGAILAHASGGTPGPAAPAS